ncbi:MAG: hypothetical protein KJ583_01930 [Nanoarchaeota archaeon]|nr:hypothetical protein [Nanoarchaeota archaeon]MBU1269508.1 hypothetical protein [Nanoarchaeota archaeon]MBU1604052.1 hypothetical protein [Nanoarchaeota archaeon]MBU2442596.1 hypothetical protein [Nanoarchaeota archaeon]
MNNDSLDDKIRELAKSSDTKYEQLRDFGVRLSVAKPFIEVDGKRQTTLV